MNESDLDVQIEKLRKGDTLTENEVKMLCDKVGEIKKEKETERERGIAILGSIGH